MSDTLFDEIPYPSSRQFTFDVGRLGRGKHHVQALLEVDVTEARRKVKQHRHTGRKTSFTAWMIKVVADCVARHPAASGINAPRRNQIVVFRDVDIAIVVEKTVDGSRVPLPYVIRRANQKNFDEIHVEIEAARDQPVRDESQYILGRQSNRLGMKLVAALPQWLRLIGMRVFLLDQPQRVKQAMGTVMLTTVGMVGHTRGWMIPFSMHPLCIALGSLNEQAAVYKGDIQKRQILHVTILIDHDVIDGMPAARFVDDLVRSLECGEGL